MTLARPSPPGVAEAAARRGDGPPEAGRTLAPGPLALEPAPKAPAP
ncbi:MAG: hypothetical protein AAF192_07525 [Pseudomonadota bacterium]